MQELSVCMIVKDEEAVLERCLTCVNQFADEVIVVDTGSVDKSIAIAKAMGAKVFSYVWGNDFSKARNYALDQASKKYVMWIDADDVVFKQDIEKINVLKQELDESIDIVMMKYHTALDEFKRPIYSYYRERIVKNNQDNRFVGFVHEVMHLKGNIVYKDIAITHQKMAIQSSDRNLKMFEKRIADGFILSPREVFYYARELYYHQAYREAYDMFEGFLNDQQGWVENNIDACELMGFCAYAMDQEHLALACFFRSFVYDLPRGELCCDIGLHFFDRQDFHRAIYWYEQARLAKMNLASGGFVREDCYGYIPCLQLCVCYDKISEHEKASEYNELAAVFKESEAVVKNREYFLKREVDSL